MSEKISFKSHAASIINDKCPDVSKVQAEYIVELVFQQVKEFTLNQPAMIRGFGSFRVKTVKERLARNPATGAVVRVPEKKKLAFKPAKEK